MAWLNLLVEAAAEDAEALSDALLDEGAVAVGIEDAEAGTPDEQARFGEPGEAPPLWPRCVVSALLPETARPAAVLAAATAAAGIAGHHRFQIEHVADDDWVQRTQAQFEPIEVTPRLWIVPTWHEPPAPDAINIRLDPGQAFGTGAHPTTRMCLRWLAEHVRGGESVLDYGCGSGILAIAAARLGAADVRGVDIDPAAVAAARINAHANGVVARFDLPEAAPVPAQVTIANILANPLRVLAPLLAAATREGGAVVLAGLLTGQAETVMNAYRPWFDMAIYAEDTGWACLAGTKRAA